jgi:hypothetical protein
MASSVDRCEGEFASCVEDGEALHSEFSESSTSFQGSDPPVRKKIKRNNDAESSEAQQAQRKNADTACSKRVCMKIDGRKLNINGRIISLGSKESVFMKLLFEKRNICPDR